MNIGNEWSLIAVGTDAGIDVLHILCLAGTLCGEAHQFAASLDDFLCLTDASLSIIGVGGGHRLDADRIIATQVDGSDIDVYKRQAFISMPSMIRYGIGRRWSLSRWATASIF